MTKGWLNDDFDVPGDITAGGIESTPIGDTTPSTGDFTEVDVDNVNINGNEISVTNTNGGLTIKPNGTASLFFQNGSAVINMRIYEDGYVTKPLQPAFQARLTSTISNVTGDSTVYGAVIFNAETFDNGGDFVLATSIFTSPVTGNYFLNSSLRVVGFLSGHTQSLHRIVTSNREYSSLYAAPDTTKVTANNTLVTAIADMDSADTSTVSITVSGSTKVIDLQSNASDCRTTFQGWLLG